MSTSKYFDRICAIIAVLMIAVTAVFMNAESLGATSVTRSYAYEDTLFDTDTVHTIDIVIDDWDGFLETATQEEYVNCTVIIDGKAYKNVAIRAKGNTSLTNVAQYGNNRYSFKLEFDHYDDTNTYYGLDKLSLNNIIQDNTYMKDYLVYTLMRKNGVDAPLCSFVYITVNGEDWGLYLAVEAIEDSFLSRTYGSSTDGELY
ncbi:MAG: CotH kinase family protein, partial [Lachnospiraceae bacterium]|nr:CotH kinase family protein [Lachnospiraceae bacterium]